MFVRIPETLAMNMLLIVSLFYFCGSIGHGHSLDKYRMCFNCQCYYARILKCTGSEIVALPQQIQEYFQPIVIELSFTGIHCINDIQKYKSLEVIYLQVNIEF